MEFVQISNELHLHNHMPWKVSEQRHPPQSKVSGVSFDLLKNRLLSLVTVFASSTVTVFASLTVTVFAFNCNNACLLVIKLFAIMLVLCICNDDWNIFLLTAFATTLKTVFVLAFVSICNNACNVFAGACKSICNNTGKSIYNNACNIFCRRLKRNL